MSATARPRSDARKAAAYPPGPPPTTTTWVVLISRQVGRVGRVSGMDRVDWRRQSAGSYLPDRPDPPGLRSSLKREQEGLLERLDDPAQEADAIGAVDHAMIVRQRERQHQARLELTALVV